MPVIKIPVGFEPFFVYIDMFQSNVNICEYIYIYIYILYIYMYDHDLYLVVNVVVPEHIYIYMHRNAYTCPQFYTCILYFYIST